MSGKRFPSDSSDQDTRAGDAALQWARQQGLGAQIAASSRARRRGRQQVRRVLGGAGVCLLLVAAVGLWPRAVVMPPASQPATHPLIVSAPLRQILPDGSVVELKSGAKIHVDYGAAVRRVRLDAGEAHFAVAKNHERPFVVTAGAIEVRALGTEFAVELRAQGVDVLVTEGRVAVERPASLSAPAPLAPLAVLDAGQAVAVELGAAVPPISTLVTDEERRSRLAWRVPRIELSRTSLAEVVECFDRHGVVRLRLADPSLGALQLSGVLRPDSAQALLHILKSDFGLLYDRAEDGTIVLRRP